MTKRTEKGPEPAFLSKLEQAWVDCNLPDNLFERFVDALAVADLPAPEPLTDERLAMLVGAAEAMIGFAQETIGSPAAKRFDDYYVPRLRAAIAALSAHPTKSDSESPLREALREIAFLGLDRPAAMGGTDDRQDANWYRSRAHAAIGIAARALEKLK